MHEAMDSAVLVIDVGGSHVKLACGEQRHRFDSSPNLTPIDFIHQIHSTTAEWAFEFVSLGLPCLVGPNGPKTDPANLGPGWVGFDFQHALGKPVRMINDAAMQALGAYTGGRMLFLGFGTGLGSALIADNVVVPLELGDVHNLGDDQPLGVRLGKKNLEAIGEPAWRIMAIEAIKMFQSATAADHVVIGGGHADLISPLPPGVVCGGNDDAITGGIRLWEQYAEPHAVPRSPAFRVLR